MRHWLYILSSFVLHSSLFMLTGCSTTSHLPEDEVLYTGIKSIKVEDKKNTYAESVALEEVEAALAYAPNASFMGSSSVRSPLPIGLWLYNSLVDKPRVGLNKWLFNSFASAPITIANVSPATRTKVASNLLQNYGYFRGNVDYSLVNQTNPRKQKISYDIKLGTPYVFDTIRYEFPHIEDSIIRADYEDAYIHKDGQFSTLDLASEKARIVDVLRDNGFYYYRTDYINFFADSINNPYHVKLLVTPSPDAPERTHHQYHIGNVSAYIRNNTSPALRNRQRTNSTTPVRLNQYSDSLVLQGLKIAYQGDRIPIKPRVMFKNFKFWKGHLFNQTNVEKTITNLHNMNIFSSVKLTFTPRQNADTLITHNSQLITLPPDTLDVRLDVTMDQPINAELDFNITQKSNSQVGPHLGVTFSKRNAFHHGETLSIGLKGSYEWQTEKHNESSKRIDSYEAGINASLTYPWIAFPGLSKKIYRHTTSTSFMASLDHLNRSSYYRMVTSDIEAKYGFQTSRSWNHEFTPISVAYNKLLDRSQLFNQVVATNQTLYASMRDQFIPAMRYAISYDNAWNPHLHHRIRFEASAKESANLLNLLNSALGFDYCHKDKKLLGTPYSQFLKLNCELKNNIHLTKTTEIATRVQLGMVWSYGNSSAAPFSELLYAGGANSIRAFGARTIGPGSFYDHNGIGSYFYQTGDFKLELNAEYRFPIVNTLYGALFVDAGNVWLMHTDSSTPQSGAQLTLRSLPRQLALGTGAGLRYDLQFLVLRLDLGVGIHAPYDTGKHSYYNLRKFSDGLGIHFAVGYPF